MFIQMFLDLLTLVGIAILLGIGIITVMTVISAVVLIVNAVKYTLHEKKEDDTNHE